MALIGILTSQLWHRQFIGRGADRLSGRDHRAARQNRPHGGRPNEGSCMSGVSADVRKDMRGFIEDNFLYMRPDLELADGDLLLSLGVIDSLGFVELVEEVQARYAIDDRGRRDHRGELRLDRCDRGLRRAQAGGRERPHGRRGPRGSAARIPDKVALDRRGGDPSPTASSRSARAGFAAGLAQAGVERGDRVALRAPERDPGGRRDRGRAACRGGHRPTQSHHQARSSPLRPRRHQAGAGRVRCRARRGGEGRGSGRGRVVS